MNGGTVIRTASHQRTISFCLTYDTVGRYKIVFLKRIQQKSLTYDQGTRRKLLIQGSHPDRARFFWNGLTEAIWVKILI